MTTYAVANASVINEGPVSNLPELRGSAANSFAYYGQREGWYIGLSVHRDSDVLERSNWRVIVPTLLADYPKDAAIERMHHWAVGWIDYLLVRPGTAAVRTVQEWRAKLADYPIANESDYSDLEYAEEWCVRCDRGIREDHPLNGCRQFRSADEADEIRGRWQWRGWRSKAKCN